jgi:hypothetical protein
MADNIVKIKFTGEGDLLRQIEKLDKATKSLINAQAKLVNQNNANVNSLTKMLKSLKLTGQSFSKLGISQETITKAYKGNRVAIQRLKIAHDKYIKTVKKAQQEHKKLNTETKKTTQRTRILGGSFAVIRSKLLLFNFAMALGIRQLILFTKESSKLNSMKASFDSLSRGAMDSKKALEDLKNATNNTMSEFDLLQQANNALVLGVAKTSEEMSEMFDIAQRLGRALGRDTRSSVESLITGIGRQSRLMLDNIGIIVKTKDAYALYAQELNKTVDALTESEQKQAFLNATLESARQKVNLVGQETRNAQSRFEEFTASLENAGATIGNSLTPLMVSLARAGTFVADGFSSIMDSMFGLEIAEERQLTLLRELSSAMQNNIIELQNRDKVITATIENIKKTSKKAIEEEQKAVQSLIDSIDLLKKSREEQILLREQETLRERIFREETKGMSDEFIKKNKLTIDALVQARLVSETSQQLEKNQHNEKIKLAEERIAIIEKIRELEEKLAESRANQHQREQEANLETQQSIIQAQIKATEEEIERTKTRIEMLTLLRGDERQNEIDKIIEFSQQMEELGLNSIEIEAFIAREKEKINNKFNVKAIEDAKKRALAETEAVRSILNAGKAIVTAQENDLNQRVENELNALKKTDAYKKASTEQREIMENKVNATFASERKKLFNYNKGIAFAEATIALAEKIIQFSGNPVMQALITGLGAVQLSTISAQTPPQFETGGLVGGRRHSQGGTLIEAEQGEFVMSRSAVQAVGLEQMNEINQGGTGGVTVNVTAPLVDETVVDSIIPAIEKATRLNLA